jgi:flagellar basal-body rod protein FlgF
VALKISRLLELVCMLTGIYSAASALRAAEFNQDVVATNLAHMNVPGFRKSMMTVRSFDEELAAQAGSPGYGQTVEGLAVDFSIGPMENTGRSLDVAIDGEGFFVVQGQSESLYTRNGSFQVGEGGSLTTAGGLPVLGQDGPLSLPPDVSAEQIRISRDGTVSVGETQIGKLELVRFENQGGLTPAGTTLFSADATTVSSDVGVFVRQGVREQSNVSPVDELVEMIVAMRYHEAAQRTLKSIDNAIQQQTNPQG